VAFAETQKLIVQLDLAGNLNQKLGAAARSLQGFDKATSNTQRSLSKFGRNLERGIVLGATAAAGGFLAVTKAAGDFEAQMNTIATIVDRKDIPRIGDALRKTARETGISLDDLTSAYYDLASAGVKGQLATDALNDAVKLGIGGLATTAETVDLLTTAINAYKLDSAGAAKATDQFALAVADGKVKASEIAATFADVASVAKAYGVGIDQIAASYAFLTAQGVPATEVTTEMNRAIISLISPTKALAEAGKKLGVNWENEIRKKGLVPALDEIRAYSEKTHTPLIDLFGRIEAVKYTLQTTGPQAKGFAAELAKMGQASGTAAAQMAERQQGLNYQLAILKAGIKDAAITIGSELLPKLTPLIKRFNEFLNLSSTQSGIREFAGKLATEFTKLADAVGKVDWTPFVDGLRLSGDIAKTVIGAFRSLPEDLQKLVIAGFALNKVTGGLGTSIAKDLGGALLNQFAQRGSSPANPLWVAQVGGGIGPGLPAVASEGGLVGAVKSAAKWIVPLAVAAAVVEIAQDVNNTKINSPTVTGTITRSGGAFGLPNGGRVAAPMTGGLSPEDRQNASDHLKRLDEKFGEFAPTLRSVGHHMVDAVVAMHADFRRDVHGLTTATKANDVAKFAKRIASEISKGIGNADSTKGVLAQLKRQLATTHDPKLQAVLRDAIAKVQAKIPGREYAQRQINKVNDLLKDGRVTRGELKTIAGIERSLKDHGLPHAANEIKRRVDAARAAQVRAALQTTRAVERQRLSVTVNTYTSISVRDQIKREHQINRVSLAPNAS